MMKAHVLDTHLRLWWSETASWRKQEISQVLKDEEGWRRGRGWEEERTRAMAKAWWEREWCLAQAARLELGVRMGRGRRRGSAAKERALLRSFYCSLGTVGSSGFSTRIYKSGLDWHLQRNFPASVNREEGVRGISKKSSQGFWIGNRVTSPLGDLNQQNGACREGVGCGTGRCLEWILKVFIYRDEKCQVKRVGKSLERKVMNLFGT